MYNEAKLKQEFWTNFGQYMLPVLSADGEKPGWLNYKTGVKHLFFKMDAGRDYATIGIYIRHPDETVRAELFQRFNALQALLEDELQEQWEWKENVIDEHGKSFSQISKTIHGVNIFERSDWPRAISFFKSRIMALDSFWSMARESFTV